MMQLLPKLYAVTDTQISGLSHTEQTKNLIERGFQLIQLRDKSENPRRFLEDAAEAVRLAHQNGVRIIVNDRADIALACGADGVHIGQEDLPPSAVRRILGEKALIGFSTHNVRQAAEARSMLVDYIAAGPIFATQSKENPDPTIGLDGLREMRRVIGDDFPLVAIGGIKRDVFEAVFHSGADCIALIGDLWRTPETPLKAV